jgi:hypothetical protein
LQHASRLARELRQAALAERAQRQARSAHRPAIRPPGSGPPDGTRVPLGIRTAGTWPGNLSTQAGCPIPPAEPPIGL